MLRGPWALAIPTRTSMYDKYSGSMEITARLDHVIVKQHLVQTDRMDTCRSHPQQVLGAEVVVGLATDTTVYLSRREEALDVILTFTIRASVAPWAPRTPSISCEGTASSSSRCQCNVIPCSPDTCHQSFGFELWGFGCGVWGLGFGVWG